MSFGIDYKGLSLMAQLYGVFNITMPINLDPFKDEINGTVFEETTDVWTPENTNAFYINPRLATSSSTSTIMLYDGSYLRFKTLELAYTFSSKKLNLPLSFDNLKIYVNGNNLAFWSDLPDDRESYARTYPMFKRYNFGFKLNF